MSSCRIWTTFSFEGFHSYPDAPPEVDFLRSRHRHIFHVRVEIEVFHNNRNIEFIKLKHVLKTNFPDNSLNDMSCEMIADEIVDFLRREIPQWIGRKVVISVSEDNENGSIMESVI